MVNMNKLVMAHLINYLVPRINASLNPIIRDRSQIMASLTAEQMLNVDSILDITW